MISTLRIGAVITWRVTPCFKTAHKIFMKDVCSIGVSYPARAALKNSNGAVIIAIAKYGRGAVFAVGDPWFYNEYTNGRLPAGFENDKAANDVAEWLIETSTEKVNAILCFSIAAAALSQKPFLFRRDNGFN